jgi:hypothetical protein
MALSREQLKQRSAPLAAQGVYGGTSAWKYPGWCGTLYDRGGYEYRGKFTVSSREARLGDQRNCSGTSSGI